MKNWISGLSFARRSSNAKWAMMLAFVLALPFLRPDAADAEAGERMQKIEHFIEQQKEISKIPGLSVVIVEKGEVVYQKGFGYADVSTKTAVTSSTLFELGSASKAFTGLAILHLEQRGLLDLSDDVQDYIPWLELKYNGERQTIRLDQLLHHTSGIASASIARIPESNDDNALEMTVRTLLNQPLNREPGRSFEYATINYDVLGYVIETVAKQPFDVYMKRHILEPIGMNDTIVGLHQLQSADMATGYKIGFMSEQAYTPPVYRGNIPAGYFISNSNDIAKWMKLQLGNDSSHAMDKRLIQKSHEPDLSVEPFDQDTYYASGWGIMTKNRHPYVFHAGENPTFSSYIVMRPDEQLGVAVLSNMNSSHTTAIGQGVMELWEGRDPAGHPADPYQKLDRIATTLCLLMDCFGLLFLWLLLRSATQLARKQRIKAPFDLKRMIYFTMHTLAAAAVITLTVLLPDVLLGGLPWSFIKVWAPTTISVFAYSLIIVSVMYYIFGCSLIFTKKRALKQRNKGGNPFEY